MSVLKRGGRPTYPAKVLLSLTAETHELLRREAEETQSTVAGVARSMIARLLAQDAKRRPAASPARHDDDARAA